MQQCSPEIKPTRFMVVILLLGSVFYTINSHAQKSIQCDDGTERPKIEIKTVLLSYEGSTFAGTLNGLGKLTEILTIDATKLLQANAATRQWNAYLKGLVSGWNNCIISKPEYNEGLKQIYPRLKNQVAEMEQIRSLLAAGKDADMKHLEALLANYYLDLQRFAEISRQELLLKQINAVVKHAGTANMEVILEHLNILKSLMARMTLASPDQLLTRISKEMPTQAGDIIQTYNSGYELVQQYRFDDAVPVFNKVLTIADLPEFHHSLGTTLLLEGADILRRQKRNAQDTEQGKKFIAEGREQLEIAAKSFMSQGNTMEQAGSYLNLGSIYNSFGNDEKLLRDTIKYNQKALKLLNCAKQPQACIQGYQNLAMVHEKMPWRTRSEREKNLSKALNAIHATESLAKANLDPTEQAYLKHDLAVILGQRYAGGRDKNIHHAIKISEEILPELEQDKVAYVLLLNHLGNLYIDWKEGDRIKNLRQARQYFARGLAIVSQDFYPEYNDMLSKNVTLVETLIKHGAPLRDEEMLARLSIQVDEFQTKGKTDKAIEKAWEWLHFAQYRYGTMNINVGMAHNMLGSLYSDTGKNDTAYTHLYCSVVILSKSQLNNDNWLHLLEFVNKNFRSYLTRQGRAAEYQDLVTKAEYAADQADYHFNHAIELYEAGDNEGAHQALDKSLELFPCNPDAWANRGVAKTALGDQRGAANDYNASLTLNPNDPFTRLHRAELFLRDGQWTKAISDLNLVIAVAPDDYAYLLRAMGREQLGMIDQAIADLKLILDQSTDAEMKSTTEQELRRLEREYEH